MRSVRESHAIAAFVGAALAAVASIAQTLGTPWFAVPVAAAGVFMVLLFRWLAEEN